MGVSCWSQKTYDDRGFEHRTYFADLRLNIYASYEQYQKRLASMKRDGP